MEAFKLASKLGITYQEAKELMARYFEAFPSIKILMDKLVKDMFKNKYANSPLDGRKLFFNDVDWDDQSAVSHCKNQAMNFPFQGAGASTTKQALIYIKEEIRKQKFDAKILFAVHDNPFNFVVYKTH